MSEEQQDHRIDDEPTEARKAELEAAYQQNTVQDKAPYAEVPIATYGELLWVFEQRNWSVFLFSLPDEMQRPNLSGAYLAEVNLSEAVLCWANLSGAFLVGANLSGAALQEINLSEVVLANVNLSGANLSGANLSGVILSESNLSGAFFYAANLSGVILSESNLSGVSLGGANLSGAFLHEANLSGVILSESNLSGASLARANLSGADLREATLSGVDLSSADLTKAKLKSAIVNSRTILGDITWDGVNLSQINWESVQRLGDDDKKHPDTTARAYRQVATQLRSQGMNEVADRFAYQAQLWQRRIMCQRLRWTNLRSLGPYLGSLLLWSVAGYGYRPGRTFLSYLVVVLGFAALFFVGTHNVDTHLANLT